MRSHLENVEHVVDSGVCEDYQIVYVIQITMVLIVNSLSVPTHARITDHVLLEYVRVLQDGTVMIVPRKTLRSTMVTDLPILLTLFRIS